jgi:uncharacterized protein
MSAANPKPQEPSMEEILASIRRIIADDQEVARMPAPKPAPVEPALRPAPAAPSRSTPELAEVLELTAAAEPARLAMQPQPPAEEPPELDWREEPAAAPFEPEPIESVAPPPRRLEPAPKPRPAQPLEPADELVSHSTHAAVGEAFNMLAHTVSSPTARSLEDLVREMLRPMLKNWLDDNLPTIVERLVRAEIERVARGGR